MCVMGFVPQLFFADPHHHHLVITLHIYNLSTSPIDMNDLKIYSPTPLAPTDYSGISKALAENGVAVVTDILQEREKKQFLDSFWEAVMRRRKALQRDDPSTWTADNTDWYGTFGAGQYKAEQSRAIE
jgi:hypothetical protein